MEHLQEVKYLNEINAEFFKLKAKKEDDKEKKSKLKLKADELEAQAEAVEEKLKFFEKKCK